MHTKQNNCRSRRGLCWVPFRLPSCGPRVRYSQELESAVFVDFRFMILPPPTPLFILSFLPLFSLTPGAGLVAWLWISASASLITGIHQFDYRGRSVQALSPILIAILAGVIRVGSCEFSSTRFLPNMIVALSINICHCSPSLFLSLLSLPQFTWEISSVFPSQGTPCIPLRVLIVT